LVSSAVGEDAACLRHESRRFACQWWWPESCEWDRTRIEQIINNLLFNAIKFGAGKPIEITVEEDGDQALLAVRDYGIGIEAQDMVRIFDRFERAVSAQHYGGLGLGLYIARRLVEGQGGTISVASEPGRGSAFEVKLPLSPTDKSSGSRVLP